VHWGPVLYREGDYLGAGVNLAARLVAVAERHQVLVSAAVRERVADLAGVELVVEQVDDPVEEVGAGLVVHESLPFPTLKRSLART
jgi:class 3 adenylate cyclase